MPAVPEPGDVVISPTNGEERVVVDVADHREQDGARHPNAVVRFVRRLFRRKEKGLDSVILVLRFPDGDSRRETDESGGDIHLFSEMVSDLKKTRRRRV